jgi:pyruvate,water dikinase
VYTVPFRELGLDDVTAVGGKSAHLGDLTQAGFPVPPGFAVTSAAFDEALEMPPAVAETIATSYAQLAAELGVDNPPVAVRSSAVAEDAADASFAGMQSTYLWLRGAEAVLEGVRRCWASYFNPEALAYREQHGGAAGMGVAVQYMVDARVAGVLFTLNPVSGDPSSIAIEASYGLGVTVVGGEVTPDSYLFSKVTRELLRSELGTKKLECVVDRARGEVELRDVEPARQARPCLVRDEIVKVAELGRGVERHYGRPQDVEWAIDWTDELFLLQARPETVWSQKRPPVTTDSPIAAIAATIMKDRPR